MSNECIISGCGKPCEPTKFGNKPSHICDAHWNVLPPKLRREWWKDTDYGARRPSQAIADALSAFFLRGAL